jgi:RNA polymerase sigma factor (sigma-70 family)
MNRVLPVGPRRAAGGPLTVPRNQTGAPSADSAIIHASLAEPERFAALFDRHAQVIYRYLARRAGSEVANDLTAETFLAAFRRRDSYDLASADARPWLYGVATRVLAQHWREDARQLRIRLAAIPDLHDPGHGDRVAGDVTAAATRAALVAGLASLPTGDRDVLLLIAWEQLTYDEVARALDIPVGTVKSRLNRARMRLRTALAGTELSATIKEVLGR